MKHERKQLEESEAIFRRICPDKWPEGRLKIRRIEEGTEDAERTDQGSIVSACEG